MPRYAFHCTKTGEEAERMLKIAEMDEPQTCECGAPLLREEISRVADGSVERTYHYTATMMDGSTINHSCDRKRGMWK